MHINFYAPYKHTHITSAQSANIPFSAVAFSLNRKPNKQWQHHCYCNTDFQLRQKEHWINFKGTALHWQKRYSAFSPLRTHKLNFLGRKLFPGKKIATTFEDGCLVPSRCLVWAKNPWPDTNDSKKDFSHFLLSRRAEEESFQAPWSEIPAL